MKKTVSKVIGTMACPLCGVPGPVRESGNGRLTLVCKWQDDGCGSQVQALCGDSVRRMRAMITQGEKVKTITEKVTKKPKPKKGQPISQPVDDDDDWIL